jgi:spore germination protein
MEQYIMFLGCSSTNIAKGTNVIMRNQTFYKHTEETENQKFHSSKIKTISPKLSENEKWIRETFTNCTDLIILPWSYGPELSQSAFSVYFDTLVQNKTVNYMKESLQDVVPHELGQATTVTPEEMIHFFTQNGVSAQSAGVLDDFDKAVEQVLSGHVVIFFDKWNQALSYNALGLTSRQVSEPITEPVVQGPHMSTIENLEKNIGMLRILLQTSQLKFEFSVVGELSRRRMAFGYLEGAVDEDTLAEFRKRISKIDKEEIMETSYLEDWIADSTYSPFPQVRFTERPDSAVAALLEGKIIALISGTPTILICPGLFFEFFMSSEDYYQRTLYSSLIRMLRIIAFFIALLLPSAYIAATTFHSELIPTVLLLAILDSREGIPFPAFLEAMIMEMFFEILREAGIRLPRPIGSAVSIVGALVIGQAAIQAKIASPVMVIVVALTGIASFSLPQYSMAISIRILRFPLMALAAMLGGLGVVLGLLLGFLHLTCLKSLGQSYLKPLAPVDLSQFRDLFIISSHKKLVRTPRVRLSRKQVVEEGENES